MAADKHASNRSWRLNDFFAIAGKALSTPRRAYQRPKRKTPLTSSSVGYVLRPNDSLDVENAVDSDEDDSRPALGFGSLFREALRAESRGAAPLKRAPVLPKQRHSQQM